MDLKSSNHSVKFHSFLILHTEPISVSYCRTVLRFRTFGTNPLFQPIQYTFSSNYLLFNIFKCLDLLKDMDLPDLYCSSEEVHRCRFCEINVLHNKHSLESHLDNHCLTLQVKFIGLQQTLIWLDIWLITGRISGKNIDFFI